LGSRAERWSRERWERFYGAGAVDRYSMEPGYLLKLEPKPNLLYTVPASLP